MRRTAKIARRLQTLLPSQLGRVGEVLFNPDYDYVINGMMIDGTSYKNTVIVKTLKLVFFQMDTGLNLNHSTPVYNLAIPANVRFFVGEIDELASQIAHTLCNSSLLTQILKPYTLAEFLDEHYAERAFGEGELWSLYDISCSEVLLGQTERARAGLRELKRQWDQSRLEVGATMNEVWTRRWREAEEVHSLLDASDDVLRQHIIDRVVRNAALLGFEAVGRGRR